MKLSAENRDRKPKADVRDPSQQDQQREDFVSFRVITSIANILAFSPQLYSPFRLAFNCVATIFCERRF